MITLYHRPGTCALAPWLALEEARADYRCVDVSAEPELLASLNPRGKVPVLDTGDGLLVENVAILTYIARTYPDAQLMPADPLQQARCLSTLAWFASTLHIDYRRFLKPQVYSGQEAAHAAISARGGSDYKRDLDELDAILAQGPWVQGAAFTVADLHALVFVGWAVKSDLYDAGRRNLHRWTHRTLQRPAIQRVLQGSSHPLLRLLD